MENFAAAFGEVATLYGVAGFLAFANERFVEQFVKPISRPIEERLGIGSVSAYIALATGAALAWGAGLDLISPVLDALGVQPLVWWFGQGVSALIVGGGSHFISDIWPQK